MKKFSSIKLSTNENMISIILTNESAPLCLVIVQSLKDLYLYIKDNLFTGVGSQRPQTGGIPRWNDDTSLELDLALRTELLSPTGIAPVSLLYLYLVSNAQLGISDPFRLLNHRGTHFYYRAGFSSSNQKASRKVVVRS